MRRLAAAVVVIGLVAVPLTAFASSTERYKDKFTSISWGGSDGSLSWAGPWTEISDDGDEKKGNVRVVSSGDCPSGSCLWMAALTTLLGPIGVRRAADTSGFEDLFLRFDLEATPSLLGSELEVQVRSGGSWSTVAEYQLGSGLDVSPTIDISGHRSEDFQIRYRFSGLLLSSEVFVDNIEIYGSTIETTTTTSTTTTTNPTTTTTTTPTTTTTVHTTTSTRPPTGTATTQPGSVATTTQPGVVTTTTRQAGDDLGVDSTTTTSTPMSPTTDSGAAGTSTTSSTSTTTTPAGAMGATGPGDGGGSGGDGPSDGAGLRLATRGLQASFQGDLYGEVRGVSYLNGVDFQADYNMAVEVIRASWGWIVVLGLIVAYSILSGLDRRRRPS